MIDLPIEYNVFNVSDLSPCVIDDPLDSRMNPLQKGKDDTIMDDTCISRPFTRSQERALQVLNDDNANGTWKKIDEYQWITYNMWKIHNGVICTSGFLNSRIHKKGNQTSLLSH